MTATLQDAAEFIMGSATRADIDRIYDLCKQRSKALRSIEAAAVQDGNSVELQRLSPRYLNGLKGTVQNIAKERCDVELDEESTQVLRFTRQSRFVVGNQETYVLRGVPLSSCKVLD